MSDDKITDISDYQTMAVYLLSLGNHKVEVIKVVKDEFGLGLAEAKNMVEHAPIKIGTLTSRTSAERVKAALELVGAEAIIR